MKQLIFTATIAVCLVSCTQTFYQVYKVNSAEWSKRNKSLNYEDKNCKVIYDFWEKGGDAGFMIYNKSDKDIFVNMKESFFICNGIAYDYYKNREFTSSNSTSESSMYTNSATNTYSAMSAILSAVAVSDNNYPGFRKTNTVAMGSGTSYSRSYAASASRSVSNTSNRGVNVKEKDIICIPPNSAKVISEYNITETLYKDCNLFLKPSKKNIKTSKFSEENSPFIFSNRITYTVDGQSTPIKIEQKFFVSEITNYPEKEITEFKVSEKPCDDEVYQPNTQKTRRYFKNVSPDKFYIPYDGSKIYRKH
ncbi:hypothetical protein AGMMS4956_02120 [Bacteroidia bacterium]|nr:hypothetical protein AGMMS4956_02120 [Bacteroidia bacterium]